MNESYGRDHHAELFHKNRRGRRFQSGLNHGETDDFSYRVVKDEVTVHDLHATILHQLGIDHERLTYHSQGGATASTDVEGKVVRQLIS